jgi:hypothetical protein
MAVAAESAIRAWINARHDLTGPGNPLARGAFLQGSGFRSPADGAYCLLYSMPGTRNSVVAEDANPSVSRVSALVYAGTIEAAEAAAVALAEAWNSLNGCPEPCGDTGVTVMVTDNLTNPAYVAQPGSGGEQYCFQTSADFMLRT